MAEEHEASIGGMKLDKKHLLYIGGAFASIVALIWIMKNRQASNAMPVTGVPSMGAGGGASSDATQAAAMAAATNLAIEQGREAIAQAQIASNEKIALANQQTQLGIAQGAQSTARAGMIMSGLTSPAGAALGGDVLSTLKSGIAALFKAIGLGGGDTGTPGGGTTYPNPIGPNVPEGWSYDPSTGEWGPTTNSGTMNGSIQDGSSGWFGNLWENPPSLDTNMFPGVTWLEPGFEQPPDFTDLGAGSPPPLMDTGELP